jgi:hypothetical protein
MMMNQSSGSQTALLTFGLSLMSRRKRKTMRASVRRRARRGGRETPNKLAMWGSIGFTLTNFSITSSLPLLKTAKSEHQTSA